MALQSREEGESGEVRQRAVKSIRVNEHNSGPERLHYVRELEALAKFSQEKVGLL